MSFLDRIAECNRHDLAGFVRFVVAGTPVGWVKRSFAARLTGFPDVFTVDDETVAISPLLATYEARTRAVADALRGFAADGTIKGWRGELYPVGAGFHGPHLLAMERTAIPFFGVRAYGVHVNGFVRRATGLEMWIGRRAVDKPTFPGMLDNFVAGGQPVGIGLLDNVIKEADEEAGVPAALARQARPIGLVSYCQETADGLKPDVLFNFDLELPDDFAPINRDGEIAAFHRWPVERVMAITETTRKFKFNCNLVNIDFFVRHGLIPPDHPDYVEIVRGLHG
ncbi:MAG: DUF4743 domain-containing protein [Alphaproteobacteria bacterium]|nr:DUF4743 domain-containing protein [Alphaproteobacteria bacterium]